MHLRIWGLGFFFDGKDTENGPLTSISVEGTVLEAPDEDTQQAWNKEVFEAFEAIVDGVFLRYAQTQGASEIMVLDHGKKDSDFCDGPDGRVATFTYRGQVAPGPCGQATAVLTLTLTRFSRRALRSLGVRLYAFGASVSNERLLEQIIGQPDLAWSEDAQGALARLQALREGGTVGREGFFRPL